jgi:FkbM family methyltransferase
VDSDALSAASTGVGVTLHKRTFDWPALQGSPEALKWNMRDLSTIDAVLGLVAGRTCCVQAGGNLGVFGKYLAKSFGSVLTFEPSPELFPKMVANAPELNILRFQAALGETPNMVGTTCRRRGNKKAGIHEGLTHIDGPGIVPTIRLDDFHLPVLDLLYLDLEGFELYALKGSVDTITRCLPVIVVEVNQNASFYGLTRDEVRDWIVTQGYRFVQRLQSDEVFVPCR